jgi:hypothetical protein
LPTKPIIEPGGNTFAEMVGHNATPETVDAAREADTLALKLASALARADALRPTRAEEGAMLEYRAEQDVVRDFSAEQEGRDFKAEQDALRDHTAEQEVRRDIRIEQEARGLIAEQQESYPLPPPQIPHHTANLLDLTDEERETLAVLLRKKIGDAPFPLSSRLAPLRAILTKVEPPTARPERPLLPSGTLTNRKKSRR